jgi:hypothetical protein
MFQSISDKIINQRYYSLILNSLGEKIRINLISGETIEGLLYTIDPINNEYLLINNPRRFSRTGVPLFLKESILKIYFKEILSFNYEINNNISDYKNKKDIFKLDSDISNINNIYSSKAVEKLVKYEVKEEDKNIYMNKKLEDDEDENWDQFELNKKMYNVVSTYDENLYTTKLDKNKITEEDKKYADKMYKEIMSSSNNENDIHILEDRGIIQENDDFDEEDKYSSVIKSNNNK